MTLVKYPDPRLFERCAPVIIDQELRAFVAEMVKFTKTLWGTPVGLAAPQVGRNIRVFIALGEIFINPEIVWTPSDGKVPYREGCYSLEENRFDYEVSRPYAVKLTWQDLANTRHTKRFNGEKAQVILHEMDHLEGRLCAGLNV